MVSYDLALVARGEGLWPDTMAIRMRWRAGHGPHTGSFIVKRGASEELVTRWQEEFFVEDSLDRLSFVRAATALYDLPAVNTSDPAEVEARSLYVGPLVGGDRFIESDMDVRDVCFTHVSNARCNSIGRGRIDEMLRDVVPNYGGDLCANKNSLVDRLRVDFERLGVSVGGSCDNKLSSMGAQSFPTCSVVWWLLVVIAILLVPGCLREHRKLLISPCRRSKDRECKV
eukprot:scaffold1459_cov260-Pinguiococcus_pyrenoidosus.AAC.14